MSLLDQQTDWIKVYGLERSGTNLIKIILLHCFGHSATVLTNKAPQAVTPHLKENDGMVFSWKHGYPDPLLGRYPKFKGVAMVKNPFAWSASIFKLTQTASYDVGFCNKDQARSSLSELLRQPMYDCRTPIHRWLRVNRAYLESKYCCIVKYEDLLSNQEEILKRISAHVGLEPNADANELNLSRQTNVHGGFSNAPFDPQFYNDKKYMDLFSKDDLEFIYDILDSDRELLRDLDYQN